MNEGDETNMYDPNFDYTLGDGHTINDIQVTEEGLIYLRAERSGKSEGRIYTITYQAEDTSGNVTEATATVTVLHNQYQLMGISGYLVVRAESLIQTFLYKSSKWESFSVTSQHISFRNK
jgi:hypothetical protein